MDTLLIALRVALSLAVVLGLLWFLQRRLTRTGRAKRASELVSVVTRQGISPKASVVVVDVDGTRFLLGVTDQSVTVLHSAVAPVEVVEPIAVEADTAAAFVRSMTDAGEPVPAIHAVPVAPRDAVPSRVLEGSILSPATWRQAVAALHQGRAG